MGPVEGVAHRLVPLEAPSAASHEQPKALVEVSDQLDRREGRGSRRRQLRTRGADRRGARTAPAPQLFGCRRSRGPATPIAPTRRRVCSRLLRCEGADPEQALAGDHERLATGGQHGERRAAGEQLLHDVTSFVEGCSQLSRKRSARPRRLCQRSGSSSRTVLSNERHTECGGDGVHDRLVQIHHAELDEPAAIRERPLQAASNLQSEPRLPPLPPTPNRVTNRWLPSTAPISATSPDRDR